MEQSIFGVVIHMITIIHATRYKAIHLLQLIELLIATGPLLLVSVE